MVYLNTSLCDLVTLSVLFEIIALTNPLGDYPKEIFIFKVERNLGCLIWILLPISYITVFYKFLSIILPLTILISIVPIYFYSSIS